MKTRLTHPRWPVAFSLAWIALITLNSTAHGSLIAAWNFNDYDGVATSVAPSSGMGSLEFPDFLGDVANYSGTTLNASPGDAAGSSLVLENSIHNGSGSLEISVSTAGLSGLVISYATRRPSTGFTSQAWFWETSGGDVVPLQTVTDLPGSFGLVDLDFSGMAAIDNQEAVRFRVVFDGATGASGNNRIDNLQIHAVELTPVPEPATTGLIAGGFLMSLLIWRGKSRR